MAEINDLQLVIQANADQFRSELIAIQTQLAKLDASGIKTNKSLVKSFNLTKLAAIAASSAIVLAVTKAVKASSILAMNSVESENLVAVTFGDMTEKVTDWSNALEEALGLDAYELRRNAGVFYNIANSMGVTEDNAYRLSTGIVSLAEDMASFYNLSESDAMEKLRAGLTGETEPLKRLGIIVDETTTKQVAYNHGIAEQGFELSNAQKVMARYQAILDQTGNAQGDLVRTIESPANQLRIFQARLHTLSRTFGEMFIPVINAVLPYLNALVIVLGKAIRAIGAFFGIIGASGTASAVNKVGESVISMGSGAEDSLSGASGAAKQLKKDLLGLAGFDEMNVLKSASGSDSGSGSSGVGGSTGYQVPDYDMGLGDMTKKTNELVDTFTRGFDTIWNQYLIPIAQWIKDNWKTLLIIAGIIAAIGTTINVIAKIVGWVTTISTAIAGVKTLVTAVVGFFAAGGAFDTIALSVMYAFEGIGAGIAALAAAIGLPVWAVVAIIGAIIAAVVLLIANWEKVKVTAVNVWNWLVVSVFQPVGTFFANIFNTMITTVTNWFNSIKEFFNRVKTEVFEPIYNEIKKIIEGLIIPIVNNFVAVIKFAWEGLKLATQIAWDFIKQKVIDPVVSWIKNTIVPIIQAVANAISGAFNTMKNAVKTAWDFVMNNAIKPVVDWINTYIMPVVDKVAEAFKSAWQGVSNFLTGIWDGIKNVFRSGINWVIDKLNSFIGGINGVIEKYNKAMSGIPGTQPITYRFASIPRLATGGLITSPTLAAMGEGGYKEAVLPLDRNTEWADIIADKLNAAGGNGQTLVVKLGEETIFKKFVDYNNNQAMITNSNLLM